MNQNNNNNGNNNNNNNGNPDNSINIELNEETALGIYSNLAIITHSQSEIVCDFVQMMPGMPKGKVRSRVLMTPQNTKRFMHALIDNVKKYEQQFGVIPDAENGSLPPINFGNTTTEA